MSSSLPIMACAACQRARERAVSDFRALWPEACVECLGWGGCFLTDAATGHQVFEECMNCLGMGRCPRCGTEYVMPSGPNPVCPHCAWDMHTAGEPVEFAPCTHVVVEVPHA